MPIWKPVKITTQLPKPKNYPATLNTIYDHIKARRLDRGLSKVSLAKILDISPLTIGTWENHQVHLLPRMLQKVIQWLGYIPPLGVNENSLGGQLYIYRAVNGLIQNDIASKLKIDRYAICKVERNEEVEERYTIAIQNLLTQESKECLLPNKFKFFDIENK